MSTYNWSILTTPGRLDKWFPIAQCEHVNCMRIDKEGTQYILFHRGPRWYYMRITKDDTVLLRRAQMFEYCSWYTRIEENDYSPYTQYYEDRIMSESSQA